MSTLKTAILASLLSGHFQAPQEIAPLQGAVLEASDSAVLDALHVEAEVLLAEAGIDGVVTGRIKSPESLQAKMQRKGLKANQVLDRVALRVNVETEEECYDVFDHLHVRYPAVPDSYDDYIASPKANGYQSLHAAFYTTLGVVEFQVRTHEMHAHAETGSAAHWRYKLASAEA